VGKSFAYYNEIDPYAAQWLRNLIDAGHIAPGVVDERSIEEVQADELREFTQCHFFAGIGGWSLAARLAGWADDEPLWTGSCPCQPFSAAGKRAGTDDERHLWPVFFRLIQECRPPAVAGEQVASRLGYEWLAGVRADLESEAYAVGAVDLCAASVGAPHIRQRMWWVADSGRIESRQGRVARGEESEGGQRWAGFGVGRADGIFIHCADGKARRIKPSIEPLAHGIPGRVGRLRAYGNAIVPQVAAEVLRAWRF